jgi:trp operon repressor, proteobacterial
MAKKREESGWSGFLELCVKIKAAGDLERFFDLFLTLEEKETLAKRFLVIKALEEGKISQREIADQCKVSISQITRGSNALKIIDPALRKFLKTNMK